MKNSGKVGYVRSLIIHWNISKMIYSNSPFVMQKLKIMGIFLKVQGA